MDMRQPETVLSARMSTFRLFPYFRRSGHDFETGVQCRTCFGSSRSSFCSLQVRRSPPGIIGKNHVRRLRTHEAAFKFMEGSGLAMARHRSGFGTSEPITYSSFTATDMASFTTVRPVITKRPNYISRFPRTLPRQADGPFTGILKSALWNR